MIPALEEFMVFENKDGKKGILIKTEDGDYCDWWKCHKIDNGSQIFNEDINDKSYMSIKKLYKCKCKSKKFYALKYMIGIFNTNVWECVYDVSKEVKKPQPVNITLNVSINPDSIKDVESVIEELNEKLRRQK